MHVTLVLDCMAFDKRTRLQGSERQAYPGAQRLGSVNPDEVASVSVILRRKAGAPAPLAGGRVTSRDQFAAQYGADPADAATVEQFAQAHGLTVSDTSVAKRRLVLTGTLAQLSKAFGTHLSQCSIPITGQTFRERTGYLTIPTELEGVVVAVLGLDTRPVAKAHIRFNITPAQAEASGSFTPPQVAQLYDFPQSVNGAGQTIGIIELGGGYTDSDLQTYFSGLGISTPKVTAVPVDGGSNSPGVDPNADGEVALDIEVAGSIAPGAAIAVYFAPNTDQGFIDAITDAAQDTTNKPSVISISWGGPEELWSQQSMTAMDSALQDAATLGVTVTIAAGDSGSTDGDEDGSLHVDFPASDPYSLACGGTTLMAANGSISSEVVWNEVANGEGATGGGISNFFALPTYQSSAGVPAQPQTGFAGRGVPDVAADADPSTGYQVYFGGQTQIVGGTSAVAPLWAGLVALINQQLGSAVGFVNARLYQITPSAFHDITMGNNDDSGLGYYSAQQGWDPCTGLGSPDGNAILTALSSSSIGATSGAG